MVMSDGALAFGPLAPAHEEALAEFFEALKAAGDEPFFHPHPLTAEQAGRLVRHGGRDLYCVATAAGRVRAYGLLRGWDEGYEVPSLGIAVHPEARGSGLGRAFLLFLHAAARARGATRVRLRVYPDNTAARRLYESLGYRWQGGGDEQLVGVCELAG
jgi:ribosomal protein S18 acetylase RimI-like enzyme